MKEALEIISGVFSGTTHNYYIRKNNNEMDKILKERIPDYNEIFTLYKNRFLYEQLRSLHKKSKLSLFLNIMFCTNYLKQEFPNLCNTEINNKMKFIKQQVNYKLEKHDLTILYKNEHYHVVDRDKDITFIDDGGFANIYKCPKLDLAIKRLKNEYKQQLHIVKRFEREYYILQRLSHITGVPNVYEFNKEEYYFTLDLADGNLTNYLHDNKLDLEHRYNLIRNILEIVADIHNEEVIHRDLTPKNVLMKSNKPLIADFGLSKDPYNYIHRTSLTTIQNLDEYQDPRIKNNLINADKYYDIYALGRIINYIMTGNPRNDEHMYNKVVFYCTTQTIKHRYKNIKEIIDSLNIAYDYYINKVDIKLINKKIYENNIDHQVIEYLYSIDCKELEIRMIKLQFRKVYIEFISEYASTEHIMIILEELFISCKTKQYFRYHQTLAYFIICILKSGLDTFVKEYSIEMLNYILTQTKNQTLIKAVQKVVLESEDYELFKKIKI